jgi:glycosyltransferase involved in cell wall biosynthesis
LALNQHEARVPPNVQPLARMKTLYISYFGALKHLSQTQVIPYLKGLAANGVGVTLLTFEERWANGREEASARTALRVELRECGISWVALRYHKRPSLPATAWDVAAAVTVATYLVIRRRIDVVHARSHVPAVPALLLKLLLGRKMIFDLRGIMAEEYVDAGVWRRGTPAYRITRWVERVALYHADAVVMLTSRIRDQLTAQHPGVLSRKVEVIPCCVDLSLYAPVDKKEARARLGLGGSRLMVYAGSLGGWYLTDEMVQLFLVARTFDPGMHFLLLTQTPSVAREALTRRSVDEGAFSVKTVQPRDVPAHLQAADFAIALIRPAPSKVSSSPTKVGEYLASGLPILANRGIGDVDQVIERREVGVLIEDFGEPSYRKAVASIVALVDRDQGLATRCRSAAEEEFSLEKVGVPRYLDVYRRLGPGAGSPTQRRP